MRSLEFEKRWVQTVSFSSSPLERQMAEDWALVNMNWGRIEFWLYAMLLPVDRKQAHEWTIDFLSVRKRSEKERKLRRFW